MPSIAAAAVPSADWRRSSSWIPPWTMPKTAWRGRPLPLVPVETAAEPALGALGGARGVVAVGVDRRALVEGQGDVGTERRLDPHRVLRPEEAIGAVEEGAEGDPVLGDLHLGPSRHVSPPALDLIGNPAVGEREDLEAAGVGDDRAVPSHEAVQATPCGDQFLARREMEVEGVSEHHLVAEPGDLGRR